MREVLREVLREVVEQVEHPLGRPAAVLGHLLDAGLARPHEGELGRDEVAVDEDENQDDE